MGVVLTFVGLAVAAIILSPVILSSRDLFGWAGAPTGLGLTDRWPFLVILSLDAAAIACVLMSILCTWRGERPGLFGILIWVFAGTSAFANWRHALTPGSPRDAIWFFPLMSLLGPGILDVVLSRVRGWLSDDAAGSSNATRRRAGVSWQRWVPGLGSFTDTFGTYRTRLLIPGLHSFAEAVIEYQRLCPDGSVRVARALRRRNLARAEAEALTALHPPRGNGWPVDLMRRIPVHIDAYRRWQAAWADLQESLAQDQNGAQNTTGLRTMKAIARRHAMSIRQLQFVRRARETWPAGLPDPTSGPTRPAQQHQRPTLIHQSQLDTGWRTTPIINPASFEPVTGRGLDISGHGRSPSRTGPGFSAPADPCAHTQPESSHSSNQTDPHPMSPQPHHASTPWQSPARVARRRWPSGSSRTPGSPPRAW